MKIAIVYDCLFPNTVGGAERWYRNLAERLGASHSVTYLTRRQWGEEVPLGHGQVDIPRFVQTLKTSGYLGPLIIEREVGDQAARMRDVAHGLAFLRECLAK